MIGARDQRFDIGTRRWLDHGGEKFARGFPRFSTTFVKGAGETPGLQECQFQGERLAFGGNEEKPLPPVGRAGALDHIAIVDQLPQHAAEALLGDFENIEEIRDADAGVAVDEMQHPVVRPPETEASQHRVGVTDEVAIGEKQKLDQVEGGALRRA